MQELHNRRIVIDGKFYIKETSPFCPNPIPEINVSNLSWSPSLENFLEPHQGIQIKSTNMIKDGQYLVYPMEECFLNIWPPQLVNSSCGNIILKNSSREYEFIEHNKPIFSIQPVQHLSDFIPNPISETDLFHLRPPQENITNITIDDNVPKKH